MIHTHKSFEIRKYFKVVSQPVRAMGCMMGSRRELWVRKWTNQLLPPWTCPHGCRSRSIKNLGKHLSHSQDFHLCQAATSECQDLEQLHEEEIVNAITVLCKSLSFAA